MPELRGEREQEQPDGGAHRDVTHCEMAMSPALVATALPFLNGEAGPPSPGAS
jgi:hypothetical protein